MSLLILGGVGEHRVQQATRSRHYVSKNMAVAKLPVATNTPGRFYRSSTGRGEDRSNTITSGCSKARWMRGGGPE